MGRGRCYERRRGGRSPPPANVNVLAKLTQASAADMVDLPRAFDANYVPALSGWR
jgi:hypothetical protein